MIIKVHLFVFTLGLFSKSALTIPLNASNATSILATNDLTIPAGWQPTLSFYENGYSFTGASDPTADPIEYDYILSDLERCVKQTFENKRQNVRTRAGDRIDRVFIEDPHHVKLTFHWVMQGGAPLTFGESADLIAELMGYIRRNLDTVRRSFEVTVSKGGHVKIVFRAVDLLLSRFEVEGHQALALEGLYDKNSPLPQSNVQAVIASAKLYYDGHVRDDSPPALAPRGENRTWRKGNVRLTIGWWFADSDDDWPELSYSDLSDLMRAFDAGCVSQGAWAFMDAQIVTRATATRKALKHTGVLELTDVSLGTPILMNGTSTAGKDAMASEITVFR